MITLSPEEPVLPFHHVPIRQTKYAWPLAGTHPIGRRGAVSRVVADQGLPSLTSSLLRATFTGAALAINPTSHRGASNMLSNDFWYGFIIGALLVVGIALFTRFMARAREKDQLAKTL